MYDDVLLELPKNYSSEGCENVCLKCHWFEDDSCYYPLPKFRTCTLGYDDKGNSIVVACNSYKSKGGNIYG